MGGIAIRNPTPVYNANCMLPCAYVYECPYPFPRSPPPPSNFLLLEKHLGDLSLYICARDLLVVAGDLSSKLQLALACLVDKLIDGALGQEAADLYLALLTQAVGSILAVFQVSQVGLWPSLGL